MPTLIQKLHWDVREVAAAADQSGFWHRWDQLNGSGCDGHPLLESSFADGAARHLAAGRVLRVAGEDTHGDAIMMLVSPTSPLNWSLLQPAQAPIPFVVFRKDLSQSNSRQSGPLGSRPVLPILLRMQRVDARFLPEGWLTAGRTTDRSRIGTTIAVQSPDFATYWDSRSPSLQKSIRRSFNRAQGAGQTWRLEKVSDPATIGAAVDRYGLLESAGWKGKEGTALHPANVQGGFYRELLARFAARGDAHVYSLWFDDKLAAMRLVIAGNGMAVILKTTYDESLSDFAPGRLQLYLVLKDLMEDPRTDRIEFYTNANQDTLAWGTESREIFAVDQYRWALARTAVDVAKRMRDLTAGSVSSQSGRPGATTANR